jgi:hypothetical protein
MAGGTMWHNDGNRVYHLVLLDQGAGMSRTVTCGHGVEDREDAADEFRKKVETMLEMRWISMSAKTLRFDGETRQE